MALTCTVLVMVTGDIQARLMDTQQPMKMAAAEAVYRTQNGASFSCPASRSSRSGYRTCSA